MEEKLIKKRSSNIELLRIFAMLMIIGYHICYHCVNVQLMDENSILSMQNGWFCHPVFYKKLLLVALMSPVGQMGNAIFILISGYFMVHKGKDINLTSISKKLLLQSAFAVLMLCIASTLVYKVSTLSLKVIDFTAFNSNAWFVGYYFAIIVLAKVFLNNFLEGLDRNKYLMFLMVTFSLVQFKWSREFISSFSDGVEKGLGILFTGIFLYSLGGYIHKYNPFDKIKTWTVVAVIICICLLICSIFYAETANEIRNYNPDDGEIFYQMIHEFGNYSFVPVCLGIAFFELFRRLKTPNSRIINYLGASTFMVYLLHDNGFFYRIWDTQDWITLLYSNPILYILKYIGWIFGTFALGVVAYSLFLSAEKFTKHITPIFLKKNKGDAA